MTTIIGEPIKVIAVFDPNLKPAKFKWKGREFSVREITYIWTTREGSSSIVHFAVTDGAGLYEIAFNQSTMKWSIEKAET